MSINRYQSLHHLRAHGIACILWFEDAIAHHGVPTVVFDLYVLVLDHNEAAHELEQHGWTRTLHKQGRIGNQLVSSSPQHRLMPPLPSPHHDPVVLLPAGNWYFHLECSMADPLSPPASFVPPLPALLDAMIDGMLDGPPDIWFPLCLHICYLYDYVLELQQRAFAHRLRYDNRQFHFDVLSGVMFNTLPFTAHARRVRQELRAGKRQLQECSAIDESFVHFHGGTTGLDDVQCTVTRSAG